MLDFFIIIYTNANILIGLFIKFLVFDGEQFKSNLEIINIRLFIGVWTFHKKWLNGWRFFFKHLYTTLLFSCFGYWITNYFVHMYNDGNPWSYANLFCVSMYGKKETQTRFRALDKTWEIYSHKRSNLFLNLFPFSRWIFMEMFFTKYQPIIKD